MGKLKNRWNEIPLTMKMTTAYALTSILQRGISLITLPLFTRVLTTEQYGQLTVYQSWASILVIFLTLNLAFGSFSTAMIKFEKDRDGYISSVEGICIALTVVFFAVYFPFRQYWNDVFELPTLFVCVMVAEQIATTVILLWSGKKRFEYKYLSVVLVTVGNAIISPILAYCLVINSEEKGYARILGYAITTIIIGGVLFALNAVRGKKLYNKIYWKYALGFNIPLLAYYLSQVVFNQSDRIMISHMVGKDKAAVYGVAYSLAMILTFVLEAINSSYIPWYYEKIKNGNQRDNKTVSLIIAGVLAFLLSGVIWFAPEIIHIMAGNQYLEAVYVIPPVSASLLLLFYSQLFINLEFYYEEKKQLIWASIGAAIVNILLNTVCIRAFGFVAAAYTTLVSYILFCLANYVAMKNILKKRGLKDDAHDYKGLIIIMIIFAVISVIGVFLYERQMVRIIVGVIALAIVLIYRKNIVRWYRAAKG